LKVPGLLILALLPAVATPPGLPAAAATITAPVVFEAPANRNPAGPTSLGDAFGRVLPSGRIVHPSGTSVVVGMNAQGVALTPSGRFAIVTNDDGYQGAATSALDPLTSGGYSLAVVDTRTMAVVSRYSDPSEAFFAGILALPDPLDPANTLVLASGGSSNAVYAFDLDASGALTRDAHHTISIPGQSDPRFAASGRSFPSTLVPARTGTRVYVVDNLGNDVAQLDTTTRAIAGAPVPVGYFPLGAASSSDGLLVANQGLMAYLLATMPMPAPPFDTVPADLARASSLSFIPVNVDGSLGPAVASDLPLDRTPDGVREIGGAGPAAVVAMRTKPYAFVAMSNVDRIATVSLGGLQPKVAGGTELRLYDRGPYGTQPAAIALAPSERRLYVALSGIDAIAVLDTDDPAHLHRVGLIPTGWYPTALVLSHDGRYLYVANAKGIGSDRAFTGDHAAGVDAKGHVQGVTEDAGAVWSTLERIDLEHLDLRRTTPLALSYLRAIAPAQKNALVPQRFGTAGSSLIKHVVVIVQPSATYDALLGDLTDAGGAPYGPGNPSYTAFDASATPNLHALARAYGLAGNMYADADEPNAGDQFATAGIATGYTQRVSLAREDGRAPDPIDPNSQDPEDVARSGSIFNSLAILGKTYRDYGELLRVSGYDQGASPDARIDDPAYIGPADTGAQTLGFGGTYRFDVPAPLALTGHVDPNYPGWNVRIRDVRRAQEFVRDFDAFAKTGTMPAFTYIWLPGTRDASVLGPTVAAEHVADNDRALGLIVEYLTHAPDWNSTAIFITPSDSMTTRDHVAVSRTYAVVVSPYAKRHYLGMRHLSTVSILKTEEELLGLPALSLGDALASDLRDFFTPVPDLAPYDRIDAPPQTN
jgi:DNA-binding beta-propeller fold protein YncE